MSIRGIGKVYVTGILDKICSINYFKHNFNLDKYVVLYRNRTKQINLSKK